MSGGTISPRIVFASASASCRHSGPDALRHDQAALGHLGDRRRVLLRHVVLQPLLDAQRRRDAASADRPSGTRVPGLPRHDGRADDGRQADVEHVRRLPVPLEQQRRERRGRHGFDHAGRQAGHDVGHRHRARLEAVRLEPLHHAIVAGRRVELRLLQIGDASARLLGEHLRPAAVAPVEQHEALRLDALADLGVSFSVTSFSSS